MTHNRKNILWLTTWYPNRFDNFDGDFIQRQAWAANLFNNVIVLAIIPSPIKNYEITTLSNRITEILILIPDSKNTIIKSFRFLIALTLGFKKIKTLNIGKFDLIHSNIVGAATVLSFILSKFLKIPFIISEHWSGPLALRKKTAYNFARFISNKANAIIVLSKLMENLMRERGMKPLHTNAGIHTAGFYVVPNVVDTQMFALSKKIKSKIFSWLHVSNLKDDIKNITGILNAFSKIENKNFRLDIIGGGGEERQLEKLAADLNLLNTKVFFHGIQPHYKIAEAMQNADAFVLNSRREGLPCVILEAMSCGLPIVSTNVGGISEWVDDEVGILVPSDDETALETALVEMMKTKNNYQRIKIRDRILDTCIYEKVGKQLSEIYHKICNQN